jgi:hypothetical protein
MEPTGPESDSRPAGDETKLTPAQELVRQLRSAFVEQLQRALGVDLPGEDSALAYIDHHLSELREEDREPIITLVASGAGAWFGEFVRARVGGHWIGDGKDPRRLRLLLEPAFVHFSPVDLAYEAIFGHDVEEDDPRAPAGALIDGAYQLDKRPNPPVTEGESPPETHDSTSDQDWISARLSELSPVPVDQYYSMTGRFETLELILQMLAHRRVAEGKSPKMLTVNDYVHALAG